ncbi:MAG: histidinol-phosphate transaminase [Bacteroides sp.]
MKSLEELTRANVWRMEPYSSARDDYKGATASVFLDANENPYNTPVNRYPDPRQSELKAEIAKVKGVNPAQIFLGNGSDEAIDLLFRAFCEPRIDNVVAINPTYGMYQVCAETNDVEYRKVNLTDDFQLPVSQLLEVADEQTKLLFVCSPNNPTGNDFRLSDMEQLLRGFGGLVVIDEAYIDFASRPSLLKQLDEFPNLVVLQTFSKAWGCAAIRLGMAFASPEIVGIMSKIKYPYNVNLLTQREALNMVHRHYEVERWVKSLKEERTLLIAGLGKLSVVEKVFPTDANFVLVRVTDAVAIYNYLVNCGIIVRNRHSVTLCGNCLRITVGTRVENERLLEAMKAYH